MARWSKKRLARYDVLKQIRNRILYEAYHAAQLFRLKCLCCGKMFATSEPERKLYCSRSCRKKGKSMASYMKKGAKRGGQQKSGSGIPAPTKNNAGSAQGQMRKRS